MKRFHIAAASLLLALFSLAACSEAAGPADGELVEFALSGNPNTLDPHATSGTLTFQVIRSVYDTLYEPDRDGRIVPALAERYEVSADNTEWTFYLREEVRFHNGDELTAADVEATFGRLLSDELDSPNADEFASVRNVRATGEYEVVFELDEPYAPLLASLASGWGAILPASLIEEGHNFGAAPVGTGPFRLDEWVRDNRIVLERNEDYWMEDHPKVDGVIINIITEPSVQLQGLLTGRLHIIDTVIAEEIDRINENPDTFVDERLSGLVMVVALNTARPELSDVRVRQAISQAIDKQAVLDATYGGGVPIASFVDYTDPYYVDYTDLLPYDPEQARSRLSEIGFEQDEPLVMTVPQNYQAHVDAGQIYQEMLESVGLDVELQLVDWSTWLSDVYGAGNFDLTVIGHTGKLDPDGRLAGYGTEATYVNWVNEEADRLIREARRTTGFEARRELYARVFEIMAREVPHVYVGTNYRLIGMRTNVSGFHMDPKLDTLDFRYLTLD
jgi:peptide/nickel transport system substrate-binding protein